jgi:hypothetical protein
VDGAGLGEGDAEGDTLGCGDAPALDAERATTWPAAMAAEPVVTSVREPTGGGTGTGAGAACPLRRPATARALVADGGT